MIGVVGSAIAIGLAVDNVLAWFDVTLTSQAGVAREIIPDWLSLTAAVVVGCRAIRPLRCSVTELLEKGVSETISDKETNK